MAKVIVRRADGKILVLKRSADDDRRPGEWDFPGGHVEQGESPNQGAARELHEESGITIEPSAAQLVFAETEYFEPTTDSNTRIVFLVTIDDPEVRLSEEHTEFKWQLPEQAVIEHPHPVYKAGLQYSLDHNLV